VHRIVFAIAWDHAVPFGKWLDMTERPSLPYYYELLELSEQLHINFFELAGIAVNRHTVPIVRMWVSIKRSADAKVEELLQAAKSKAGRSGQ
jgi:hypothetical protein